MRHHEEAGRIDGRECNPCRRGDLPAQAKRKTLSRSAYSPLAEPVPITIGKQGVDKTSLQGVAALQTISNHFKHFPCRRGDLPAQEGDLGEVPGIWGFGDQYSVFGFFGEE